MAAVALAFVVTGAWRIGATEAPERRPRMFIFLNELMSNQVAHVAEPLDAADPAAASMRTPR